MTRLIDADALKATIMSKADGMEDLWDTAGVLNTINKEPTVELLMARMVDGVIILICNGKIVQVVPELEDSDVKTV